MEVVDSAGAVLGEATAKDGWFLLALPAGTASAAASLITRSSSGASVGTVPIAPPAPPTTAATGAGMQAMSGTAPA